MNESTTKRRIWIRNIIIILLIILLLLTLFSNTIMNRSLPEVSVTYPQYDTITSRIRATSTLTTADTYSVNVTQSRNVSEVMTAVGKTVKKGDVLFTLEAGDSTETEMAEQELSSLRIQLIQKKKADPSLTNSVTSATMRSLQTQLKSARADLSNAYADLTTLKADLADLQQELAELQEKQYYLPTETDKTAAETAIETAKSNIASYEAEIARLQGRQASLGGASYYTESELSELKAKAQYALEEAESYLTYATTARDKANNNVTKLQAEIKEAQASYDYATEVLNNYNANTTRNGITFDSLLQEQQALAEKQNAITQAQQYFSQQEYTVAKQAYTAAKTAFDSQYYSADETTRATLKANLEAAQAVYQPLDSQYQNLLSLQQSYQQAQQTYAQHYQQYIQGNQENAYLSTLTEAQKSAKAFLTQKQEELVTAQETQTKAQTTYTEAKQEYDTAKSNLEKYENYEEADTYSAEIKRLTALKSAEEKVITEQQKIIDKASEENLKSASSAITAKEKEITAKNREITNYSKTISTYQDNITNIEEQISAEEEKNATEEISNSLDAEQYALELAQIEENIAKKEAEIEKLKSLSAELTVTAPVSGVIETLSAVVGREVKANTTVCTIAMAENGYIMTTTVTAQQAAKVSVGEYAELQWYWGGSDPTIQVKSVTTDPNSQGKNKIITFTVTGENLQPGTSLTYTLGAKGQSYENVVPNNAVREDANGKFVLVVSAKSTPLGNRYTAKRVDVTVVASDDTKSAISGSVSGEYVITNATTPISAGMQVRLSDNS